MSTPQKAVEFNAEELQLLHRVAHCLLREGEYGELLHDLLDLTITALGATRGFVLAREGTKVRATAARNFRSEALTKTEEAVSTSIASAVQEQGRATHEITRNIQQAASGATAASRSAEAVSETAATTGKSADEMRAGTGHLADLTDVLRTEVSRFLQQVRAA